MREACFRIKNLKKERILIMTFVTYFQKQTLNRKIKKEEDMQRMSYRTFTNYNYRKHFKLYKFLFFEDKYMHISLRAKIIYTLFINKFIKLRKNNALAYDSQNVPYITMSNNVIHELTGFDKKSIKQYKEELLSVGLLFQGERKRSIYINQDISIQHPQSVYTVDNNAHRYTYFALPKYVFHKLFDTVKIEAKIVYALLRDRCKISLLNSKNNDNYKDAAGEVYTIFSNQSLGRLLDCHPNTVKNYKNELLVKGLITKKAAPMQGSDYIYVKEPNFGFKSSYNKIKTNNSNSLLYYTLFLITQSQDLVNHETSNKTKEGNLIEKKGNSCQAKGEILSPNNTTKSNTLINTEDYTMNNMTIYEEYAYMFKQRYKQTTHNINSQAVTQDEKQALVNKLPNQLAKYLLNMSVVDIKRCMGIICKTKAEFNASRETHYCIEDLEVELINMLKRIVIKAKTEDKSLSDFNGYIKKSTLEEFKHLHSECVEESEEDLEERFMALNQQIFKLKKEPPHQNDHNQFSYPLSNSNMKNLEQYVKDKQGNIISEEELNNLGVY